MFTPGTGITKGRSDEWGAATNGLRMGISLKGELGEIHTNQPLVLLMRLQNTSSNDVFREPLKTVLLRHDSLADERYRRPV